MKNAPLVFQFTFDAVVFWFWIQRITVHAELLRVANSRRNAMPLLLRQYKARPTICVREKKLTHSMTWAVYF